MKEYTYQLEKDDYREWIQWNIKKHDQKKVRYITVGVMMALLAMTLIGNLSSGAPLAAAVGSSIMFLGLGAIMLYFTSPQNQERMIYKKSGLKKMEKTGFPTVNLVLREDGFDLTEDILRNIDHELDMLFLCTPNNPTGRTIPTQLLETVARRCGEMGVRLVVGECFLELTDGAQGMAGRLEEFPTLFLLRAFTKSYAIPGLRLGYCLTADRALLERMEVCAPAWAVSVPAQAAGLAALEQPGWPQQARAVIGPARERLLAELRGLGLEAWPGQANYLLFRATGQYDLKERMATRGILLRSCANYDGLGPDYYRAAVRLPEENEQLISTLRAVLVEN